MPFVTEEIWGALRDAAPDAAGDPLLITAPWPRPGEADDVAEAAFADIAALVRGVRNLRTEASSPASAWIPLVVEPANREAADTLRRHERYLETLARVRPVGFAASGDERPQRVTSGRLGVAWLREPGIADSGSGEDRHATQVEELDRHIDRLRALLDDADFTSRAPAAVVERERARLVDLEEQRLQLAGDG